MRSIQQHPCPPTASACFGGQGSVPYEQNTQQSPSFGLNTAWQAAHSKKNTQAFSGISAVCSWLHCGQRKVDNIPQVNAAGQVFA